MPRACSRCGGTIAAAAHNLCAACLLRLATMPEARAPEYEIETLLGSGRAGTTYLAKEEGGGALLAVKILTLPDDRHDAPAVTDAIRGILTSFRHPGIARTHAVDVDSDGHARLVRDYVAGKPLAAWMAHADPASRQQAFDAIGSALAAAHAHGLFHGNVTASNIIIAAGVRPVVVDLGAHMVLRALQGVRSPAADMVRDDRAGLNAIQAAVIPPA